jgi:hypothetical protein
LHDQSLNHMPVSQSEQNGRSHVDTFNNWFTNKIIELRITFYTREPC